MSNIASKKKAITELLHLMSNESTLIKNYNFRHFFIRKTNEKQAGLDSMNDNDLQSNGDNLLNKYQEEYEQL